MSEAKADGRRPPGGVSASVEPDSIKQRNSWGRSRWPLKQVGQSESRAETASNGGLELRREEVVSTTEWQKSKFAGFSC